LALRNAGVELDEPSALASRMGIRLDDAKPKRIDPTQVEASKVRTDADGVTSAQESDAETPKAAPVVTVKIDLTPTDIATIVTVDEARASQGLPPLGGEDGALTVAQFKAKYAEVISEVAQAEQGDADETTGTSDGDGASALSPSTRYRAEAPAKYSHIDFTPPKSVRDEAKRGLEWRKEYGRGGTAVGVARARDLANGREVSPSTARRMASYFARHEVDKKGEGWSPKDDGFPSAGRIAWALWGGDPGQSWSAKLTRQMDAADEAT
jgi:hypothetical protein